MIQELLGGGAAGLFGGERKNSINGGVILEGTPSPSSSTITKSTITNSTAPNSENQNLRCPRCDSANTKFCYYNNYNLTQPRHFCKTCRRYWTKGGALRNVPIGGGCRKNKNTCISTPVGKSSAGKVAKATAEIGKSGLGIHGFDHELASNNNNFNPILWASPQNSHILALLKATQNPSPNPNTPISTSITVKDEGFSIGSNMINESSVATGAFNALTLGLDPYNQVPSFWRNNQQQNGFNMVGEVQNSGIQELYQRMRSSSNYYNTNDHAQVVMGNLASAPSSSTSSILESAPVGGGSELGYWNSAYSSTWSDLPTTNGAYP